MTNFKEYQSLSDEAKIQRIKFNEYESLLEKRKIPSINCQNGYQSLESFHKRSRKHSGDIEDLLTAIREKDEKIGKFS